MARWGWLVVARAAWLVVALVVGWGIGRASQPVGPARLEVAAWMAHPSTVGSVIRNLGPRAVALDASSARIHGADGRLHVSDPTPPVVLPVGRTATMCISLPDDARGPFTVELRVAEAAVAWAAVANKEEYNGDRETAGDVERRAAAGGALCPAADRSGGGRLDSGIVRRGARLSRDRLAGD